MLLRGVTAIDRAIAAIVCRLRIVLPATMHALKKRLDESVQYR
jgi:hypothetical protein